MSAPQLDKPAYTLLIGDVITGQPWMPDGTPQKLGEGDAPHAESFPDKESAFARKDFYISRFERAQVEIIGPGEAERWVFQNEEFVRKFIATVSARRPWTQRFVMFHPFRISLFAWLAVVRFAFIAFLLHFASVFLPGHIPGLPLVGTIALLLVIPVGLFGAFLGIRLALKRLYFICPLCGGKCRMVSGSKHQWLLDCPNCGTLSLKPSILRTPRVEIIRRPSRQPAE